MGRRPYVAPILYTSPLEAVEPNLHRHPLRPLLYSFFSFSPKSMSDHSERHTSTEYVELKHMCCLVHSGAALLSV